MIAIAAIGAVAAIVWAARRPATNPPEAVDCCSAESDSWRDPIYRRWRPHVTTYRAAQSECWAESQRAALGHDYSKPADRRCTLGRMHQYKRNAWDMCRRGCLKVEAESQVEVVDDGFDTVVGRGRIWLRISSDGPDFVVSDNRDGAEIGRFDTYAAAEESARSFFTVPF